MPDGKVTFTALSPVPALYQAPRGVCAVFINQMKDMLCKEES